MIGVTDTPCTDDLTGKRAAPLVYDPSHSHPQDHVVGYRVRQTIKNGEVLVKVGNLPAILATFPRSRYLDALECARTNRTDLFRTSARGRRVLSEAEADRATRRALPSNAFVRIVDYACVDSVYRCGCAWGDFDYMPNDPGVIGPSPAVTTYDPNMEVGRS